MQTLLQPVYDSRQSFYGKARVTHDGNFITLISYQTEVARIDTQAKKATISDTYSATTLRHIKEFLKQNGFSAVSQSQITKDYLV